MNKKSGPIVETDFVRETLGLLVFDFVNDGRLSRSEKYFAADEIRAKMPEGKAVKVTFEYIDEGVLCDGGEPLKIKPSPMFKGPKE